MLKVTYHPDVEEEVVGAAIEYEKQSEGLGERFLKEYDRAIREIREYPSAWPPLGGPHRQHQLRHFPYGVV
jgi:hypothetical protein